MIQIIISKRVKIKLVFASVSEFPKSVWVESWWRHHCGLARLAAVWCQWLQLRACVLLMMPWKVDCIHTTYSKLWQIFGYFRGCRCLWVQNIDMAQFYLFPISIRNAYFSCLRSYSAMDKALWPGLGSNLTTSNLLYSKVSRLKLEPGTVRWIGVIIAFTVSWLKQIFEGN